MNNQTIVCCVIALLLGMLLFHMLKGVCGCKLVEGQTIEECQSWRQGIIDRCAARTHDDMLSAVHADACEYDNTPLETARRWRGPVLDGNQLDCDQYNDNYSFSIPIPPWWAAGGNCAGENQYYVQCPSTNDDESVPSPTGEQGQLPLLNLSDHIRHGSTQRSNLGCYDRCEANRAACKDDDEGGCTPEQLQNIDACNANCAARTTHFESYEVDFDMEQYNQNLRSMDCGNEVFENFFNQSRQDCINSCQQVRNIDSGVLPPWDQGVCEQCCAKNAFPAAGINVDMTPSCEDLVSVASDSALGGCDARLVDLGINGLHGSDVLLRNICRDSCDGARGTIRY